MARLGEARATLAAEEKKAEKAEKKAARQLAPVAEGTVEEVEDGESDDDEVTDATTTKPRSLTLFQIRDGMEGVILKWRRSHN